MPTTSNFGWTTPADTDLVKDGAAAIRTLGNGIDTSLVDLKGGTTGQVLSKNSNTDLDYTWVTPNVGDITEVQAGTGISVASGTGPVPVVTNTVATTFDAKGDLVVGTGADTFAKLTVGTNGHTLVADSSTSTGLAWAAPAGGGANWSLVNSGGTALTGAQTITVSGITGADKIMVLLDDASSASAGSLIGIRLNADTGNNYYSTGATNDGLSTYASTYLAREEGSTSVFRVGLMSGAAGSTVCGYVLISGCNSSGVKVMTSAGTGTAAGNNDHRAYYMGGYYNSSSVITSVSVFSFTGNFDAGTVFVYTSA